MTKEHINSAFDDDLNELAKLITTMGNLALSQFTAVIDGMADDEVKPVSYTHLTLPTSG